jgi:nucleoside-diphosphate-sugar epimerase
VLAAADDVYTNHIHADDLARACVAALWRGAAPARVQRQRRQRLKMGDYFDLAADLYGLPRPPRVPRSTAQAELPLVLLSIHERIAPGALLSVVAENHSTVK